MLLPVLVLIAQCASAGSLQTGEQIHPPGYNLSHRYELSASLLEVGDTLVIARILTNGEAFTLSGLYFSDNLSPRFTIVSSSLTRNGTDIAHSMQRAAGNPIISGFTTWYWVVDDPGDPGMGSGDVGTGDTVRLEMRITSTLPGNYQLPFHTTVFWNGRTGFFATGEPVAVRFLPDPSCCIGLTGNIDCDPKHVIDVGDLTTLIDYLFISHPPLCCPAEANLDSDTAGIVDISDLGVLIDYLFSDFSPTPVCQ